MTEKKSDFSTAAMGFFGGAIVLAFVLYFISHQTTKKYEAHKAAATAEHKAP